MGLSRAAQMMFVACRDGFFCHICGQGSVVEDPWEVEHVKPLIRGGSDDLENLRLAHRSCNRRKGTDYIRSYDEIRAAA